MLDVLYSLHFIRTVNFQQTLILDDRSSISLFGRLKGEGESWRGERDVKRKVKGGWGGRKRDGRTDGGLRAGESKY